MKKVKKLTPLSKVIISAAVVLLAFGLISNALFGPVDRGNKEDVIVTIKPGTSKNGIGNLLKEKKLIKSRLAFKGYVFIHPIKSLKAGSYVFNKNMGLKEIVRELESGSNYNPNLVVLTFKEGKRITDYAKLMSSKTNTSYEDVLNVFKDREYTKELIKKYWFLTDKVLDPNIYYPLEGYLYPETYHFDDKDVEVKEIIETMLDEMDKNLDKYKDKMKSDPHYYISMASIVELEGTNTENRKMIVGIFKNRLKSGYNMGSDVTTYYAFQKPMDKDLTSAEFLKDNPYNTRAVSMIGKMPIGPICSNSLSSIEASVNPTNNDYLFFVADKHGKIYYTKTNAEHDKKVKEIKDRGDWIW